MKSIYDNDIYNLIKSKVESGLKYIGWSAGSNLACPTIRTTNDMPIVEPPSFTAFNLINYQINPHYLDAHPEGHHGETREQRIEEFIEVNRDIYVVALREGSLIKVVGDSHKLLGTKTARIFKYDQARLEISPDSNLHEILL